MDFYFLIYKLVIDTVIVATKIGDVRISIFWYIGIDTLIINVGLCQGIVFDKSARKHP